MRGAEETLVDLYVGESVFERMLFFVIEKSVPGPPLPYSYVYPVLSQNELWGGI